MNKHIEHPYMIYFMPPSETRQIGRPSGQPNKVTVPINANWSDFTNAMAPVTGDEHDSVMILIDKNVDLNEPGIPKAIDIKLNQITKMAKPSEKPIMSKHTDDVWYLLNPSWDDQTKENEYAPTDKTIIERAESYGDEFAWQAHQSKIWARMADISPLQEGEYKGGPNHIEELVNEDRGLAKEDIKDFWAWRANKAILPSLVGDDMIGLPGVRGYEFTDFTMTPTKGPSAGKEIPILVRSLKTVGMSGIAIPMANARGDVPKYQVATDASVINVMLKARAADGVSIQRSEYYNKKSHEYKFTIEGQPSRLRCTKATSEKSGITFQDIHGDFNVDMKQNIKDLLVERKYDIPELIDSIQVTPSAKYIWLSKGSMIGSENVAKTVSPSNAGFIEARPPKNGAEDYVVLVAEGALKGHIVAKYADVVDSEGKSFGDFIAKDRGIIVAQVPGVSEAFVKSVKPIYDEYPIRGTYIAMDADGRENKAVADGIATASRVLGQWNDVKVMSWNPEQKGLDDALLAIAQQKITLADMGVRLGTAEKLFPRDQATAPNPYKLNGTRANRSDWQIEHTRSNRETNAKIKEAQKASEERVKDLLNGGEELEKNLPPKEDGHQQ